ncbi:hypothetical protein J155_04298 [Xanthomonas citri pv. citri]|nr:hypothetical protein J151_04345 [Xanthomonas citri subsp. citri A306]AJY84227.1 hypothetical protein J159_04294 [Xanthomonas citri pv. citri]AJY88653.1 hypothetical protein J158_04298 [Xanthomonas citri subsp. citri UI6]AJY93121.1 hypothetical protein J169_04342 [Xanthomonas citri pv. citri]AJY97545.1 hypothetical protein J164_04295 [Xanthomonas citri pv. citri]
MSFRQLRLHAGVAPPSYRYVSVTTPGRVNAMGRTVRRNQGCRAPHLGGSASAAAAMDHASTAPGLPSSTTKRLVVDTVALRSRRSEMPCSRVSIRPGVSVTDT